MMPLERTGTFTLACGQTPPRQKGDKPGRGPELSGDLSGGQPRALEAYVLGLRDAIKIIALLLM
jgi:hypothetical protein